MGMYGNDLNAANQRRAAALRSGNPIGGGNVSSNNVFSTGRSSSYPAPYVRPQANIMDTIKQGLKLYDKGSSMYDALSAGGGAADAGSALGGATGTGAGGSLTMDLGAGSGAADTGSAASSGASTGGSALGSGLAYLGAAKTALDFTNGLGHKQGVEGRDRGNLGGQLGSAGSGAASGFSLGGPIGAIVGAAGGNEAYQMKHGNREGDLKPVIGGGEDFDFKKSLEYYLKGGPAYADIKGWLGL